MKRLPDLLQTAEGCEFLRERSIFVSPDRFRDRLRPPPHSALLDHFGADADTHPIYMGQQVYVDYRRSVLVKIETLDRFSGEAGLLPFCLWMDTDRAGSDRLMTRFRWPNGAEPVTISLAPGAVKDREPRFIELEPERLSRGLDKLATYVFQAPRGPHTRRRLNALRALVSHSRDLRLNHFNRRLTHFLLERRMQINLPSILVSEMLEYGWLDDPAGGCLRRISDVVQIFNETVERLARAGIDPVVRPLPPDYLPLYYACDTDARRLRLHHEVVGADHFAVGTCRCGMAYRFHLGRVELSIAELAATGRWSPDVLFPVLINDLVSGVVAGRSSALYGLVLNAVLNEVLGQRPIPMLVPADLGQSADSDPPFDSLIYHYLMIP